jgi:hypothetical protein
LINTIRRVKCAAAKIDGLLINKKLACARQQPKSPKPNGGVTPAVSHLARLMLGGSE